MIHVLIADDHPVVREGLSRIVSRSADMRVVAEVGDGVELFEALSRARADVVLLDISMPGPRCLDILKRMNDEYPRIGVVIVTARGEATYAVRTLKAGASGFLTKGCSPDELTSAIRRAAEGRRYVTPSVAERLADALGGEAGPPHEVLSHREFEVLTLMAEGLSGKQIAARLGISPKTVSTYRSRIRKRLGVNSQVELLRYAIREGLA